MNTHYKILVDTTNVTNDTEYTSQQVERISGYSVQFIYSVSANTDAVVKLQASNDGSNWDDIVCSYSTIQVSNATSSTKLFNCSDVYYRYFRPAVEVTTGQFNTLVINYYLKGN